MAKIKKKGLSERVQKKKKHVEKKVNPFEIKFNRSKQKVLGKKLTKFDKGMPGISRSKAIKKRESTLLVEWKKRGKANTLLDKRIGENDAEMSLEDKMLARYTVEKKKSHGKAIFNLNDDDEELTAHFGQSLAEIEKFADKESLSDEDDDDAETDKLMQEEHFGGFMKKLDDKRSEKSWKERMNEIIVQSKKAKYERQAQRDKNAELMEELDEQFKALHSLILDSKKDPELTAAQTKEAMKDDYSIIFGQLKFEATGKPSDRLKSEEELAREERERLEKLEADRLRRMKGLVEDEETDGKKETAHKSADDLDDDFDFSSTRGKKRALLNYKDGRLVGSEEQVDEEQEEEDSEGDANEKEGDDESGEDSEEEDEESEEETGEMSSEDEQPKKKKTKIQNLKEKSKKTMVEEPDKEGDEDKADDDGGSEEESEEGDDNYSDLQMDSDAEAEEDQDQEKKKIIEKLIKRKQVMEAARKEIPYTFHAPDNYENFEEMMNEYGERERPLVLERLRKCTHASLSQENTDKLKKILSFLFDYIMEICSNEVAPSGDLLDAMIRHHYEMTQQFPLEFAKKMTAEIRVRHEEYKDICGDKEWKGVFPGLDTLVLLKMVGMLFPTSDFTHRVVTPAMLFIAHVLNQSSIRNETDIAVGLFLCNLFLEYQALSKRIMPEVFNFLHAVLFTALEKSQQKDVKCFPPNIGRGKHDNLLLLKVKSMKSIIGKLKLSETIRTEENTLANDDFRLRAIKLCLSLVDNFADLYHETAAFTMLFKPLSIIIERLPVEKFPNDLKTMQARVLEKVTKPHTLTYLAKEKNKPKPLKLLEPKFDEVFEGRKKRIGSHEYKETQSLLHKIKREKKGAVREIRRDTQFLARVKLKETMERDAERKRKVKEIHGFLANQEGEFKALKRKRKS